MKGQTCGTVKTLTDVLLDQLFTGEDAIVKGLDNCGEVCRKKVNREAGFCHCCCLYEYEERLQSNHGRSCY